MGCLERVCCGCMRLGVRGEEQSHHPGCLLILVLPLSLHISKSQLPICKMMIMPFKPEGWFQELNKPWHIELFSQGRDLVNMFLLLKARCQVMAQKLQVGRHLGGLHGRKVQPPSYQCKNLSQSTSDRRVFRLLLNNPGPHCLRGQPTQVFGQL